MSSRDLYQQLILEHNKKPLNEGIIKDFTHMNKSYNPFCGDEIDVYIVIKNDIIIDIKHKTMGCSISRASASMMTEAVKLKELKEVKNLFIYFQKLVKGEIKEDEKEFLKKLSVFSGIWNYPARVKCAILPWHALMGAIEGKSEITIEEN